MCKSVYGHAHVCVLLYVYMHVCMHARHPHTHTHTRWVHITNHGVQRHHPLAHTVKSPLDSEGVGGVDGGGAEDGGGGEDEREDEELVEGRCLCSCSGRMRSVSVV